ncbi:Sen15 protein-domain-containing protein [Cladochytrium replicatum]|nr:Sen15 protein-domain-containing protein [Cladochytrium replicatum]
MLTEFIEQQVAEATADCSPQLCLAVKQAFIDLKLAKSWNNVAVHALPGTNRAMITASRPDNEDEGDVKYILPVTTSEKITMDMLKKVFEATTKLQPEGTHQPKSIYLGIVENDSSVVYYRCEAGLPQPR